MGNVRYLIQRFFDMDFHALCSKTSELHKKTGKASWMILWDMYHCAVKYGAGYMDYDLYEFYNLTEEQRNTYLTRERNNALVRKYNDKQQSELLDDKAKFNERFQDYLFRDWIAVTEENRSSVEAFLREHREFMAKPINGCCGRGIEKLRREDFPDFEAMIGHLMKEALVLETLLTQHPAVSEIYSGSVNTVRVVSLKRGDRVLFVGAVFRIGNGKIVDNFNAGGLAAPVDLESGVVTAPAVDKQKNLYERHPVTGAAIQGFAFPFWQEAMAMLRQAAQVVPAVNYVGWDVCFTPEGPCLVEGNPFPGHDLFQLPAHTPGKCGLMPTLWQLEAAQ